MKDLFTALALAVVIEGVAYALFPGPMRRMMAQVVLMPSGVVRVAGLVAAVAGVLAVWLVRSAFAEP